MLAVVVVASDVFALTKRYAGAGSGHRTNGYASVGICASEKIQRPAVVSLSCGEILGNTVGLEVDDVRENFGVGPSGNTVVHQGEGGCNRAGCGAGAEAELFRTLRVRVLHDGYRTRENDRVRSDLLVLAATAPVKSDEMRVIRRAVYREQRVQIAPVQPCGQVVAPSQHDRTGSSRERKRDVLRGA